ncbi:MAG: transporter substrate-binding domain-containing protein [Anaerolineae bacterium]
MLEYTSESKFDWREKIVFAYLDEPPFCLPGTDGQPSGCDIEVGLTILKSIGIQQVETRLVTFADLLPGVMKGQWTMNTAMFITPERSRLVDFSRPVWALVDGLIVRKNNPKELINYEAVAANSAAKLGVVKDTVQRQTALNVGVPMERIVELTTQHESIEALLTGEIDAFASTAIGNRVFVQRANDARLAAIEVASADAMKERTAPAFGAFSFAKSNSGLRVAFDAALKVYLGSSQHRTLMAQYGFTSADIDLVMEQT